MIECSKLVSQGAGLSKKLIARFPKIILDWDSRQKSRLNCVDSIGRNVGVFLPRGTVLRGNDVLVASDGSLIEVQAQAQAVLRIEYCPEHGSYFDLMRAAYHLGNRHVPIELSPSCLKIEPDHVLQAMLESMHLIVKQVNEAFEPESGAYDQSSFAAHSHHHHQSHSHSHESHHSHVTGESAHSHSSPQPSTIDKNGEHHHE